MKRHIFFVIVVVLLAFTQGAKAQAEPNVFAGAEPKLAHYDALYVINTADEKTITRALHAMANALNDPRLKGKLQLELICYNDGVAVYMKSGKFEEDLKNLQSKGVILSMCRNTVRARNIDKNDLFPFIYYVPSGNGEIILRHYEGWAVVQP